MSQSKLQAFIEEATPILTSFWTELLGQEITFQPGQPTETDYNQVTSDAATAFSVTASLDTPSPFSVQFSSTWIPVISNAMLGRTLNTEDDGVSDLTVQIATQGYEALRSQHKQCALFPALPFVSFAPGAWDLDGEETAEYWAVPFEVSVAEEALHGRIFLPVALVSSIEPLPETPAPEPVQENAIDVSSANFPELGRERLPQDGQIGNFDLLAEVELNVTVELGRRKIPLSEVLQLSTGSVIELEKLVGEPLEIFANGRLIAEGEAVVIDEQFGVRITNLASSKQRAKALA